MSPLFLLLPSYPCKEYKGLGHGSFCYLLFASLPIAFSLLLDGIPDSSGVGLGGVQVQVDIARIYSSVFSLSFHGYLRGKYYFFILGCI